jgi:predicted secreted protein
MIHRELESSFATWLVSGVSGTSLSGVPIRHAVPADPLALPCVIVASAGAELLEGGVRAASRVSMDFAVMSAANGGPGWQTAHKNRVAALSRRLDDTNTNTALASINGAQTDFTLYGWHLVELAAETEPNIQTDTIRISLIAGDRIATSPTGPTATPQNYSLRHEIEQIVSAHLGTELPSAVTDDYSVYPFYSETVVPERRIVAACLAAERPFPQLARWSAQVTIHVITPGIYATTHDEAVRQVQDTLRDLVAQDFTSANVTVAGMLETGHTIDRSDNRIVDVLAVTLYCQQN